MTKTKLLIILAGSVLGLVVVACAPSLTWVTPQGQEFTNPTCAYSEPSKDGGPPICFRREIGMPSDPDAARKEAQCQADHGYVSRSGFAMGDGSCNFPHADVGKSCRKSTDCEVACEASSHQCIDSRLYNILLDENGREVEGSVE